MAISGYSGQPVNPRMSSERWNKVNELFYAALEKDEEQRNAFLVEACGADESLRKEVESLLIAHHQAGNFIQTPAVENALQVLAEDKDQLVIGEQIGAYKIIREIGRGGMGAVYLAERADQQYEKHVAVKLVKRGMDSDQVLQRFRNERQILANFDHPNIARLLDGGSTENGLPYFVMEYVEGQPIDEYCDSRNLTVSQRLELFRQVCAAVSYAHRHLVIHRDIKPSNILVTEEGVPKLLDFGIAKVLQPENDEETRATAAGLRLMTPDYASPEQVQGISVTTASDVYSLGVVLYELLTGHRPYHFHTRSAFDIARMITETEPQMPSTVIHTVEEDHDQTTPESVSRMREGSPDRLSRRLRGDLDNIVLMAMRKEPPRRYLSVELFSEDIRRHLAGLPVTAQKDTLAYRGSKFVRRNKIAVAAATFALLTIVVSAIIGGIIQWRANQQAKFLQEFGQEAARMEGIMRFAYLLPLHDVRNEAQMVEDRLRLLEEKMNQIGGVAYGPGNYALGRGWMSLHEYEKARDHLEQSWNRYQYREPQVANALGLTLAMLYQRELEKASRIRSKAEREERMKTIEKEFRSPALEYVKQGKEVADSPEFITALILFLEKKDDAALSSAEAALKRVPWLYEARKLQADILTDKANALGSRGEYDAAVVQYGLAEATYHKAIESGRSDAEIYRALCGMQNDLLMLQVYETGESPENTFSKSEASCMDALKARPDSAETYSNLLSIYIVYAYYQVWTADEDARPVIEKGIEAGERALRIRSDVADTQRRLGRAYISRGEYDLNHGMDPRPWLKKATEHLDAAIRIDPETASAHANLGTSQYYYGLYVMQTGGDPLPYLERSIQGSKKAIEIRPTSAGFFRDLGAPYLLKVEYELIHGKDLQPTVKDAIAALKRAIELNPNEQIAHFNLGQAHIFQALYELSRGIDPSNSLEKAQTSIHKAIEINPKDDYSYQILGWSYQILAQYAADSGANPEPYIQKAEMNLNHALSIVPERAITLLYIGMLYSLQSDILIGKRSNPGNSIAKARNALEKARAQRPEVLGEVLVFLGKTELNAARWNLHTKKSPEPFAQRAVEVLEEAVRTNGQLAEAHLTLAKVDLLRAQAKDGSIQDRVTSGLQRVEKTLELNPQLAHAFVLKGKLLQMQNSAEESNAAFDQAFRINPLLKRKYRTNSAAMQSS